MCASGQLWTKPWNAAPVDEWPGGDPWEPLDVVFVSTACLFCQDAAYNLG